MNVPKPSSIRGDPCTSDTANGDGEKFDTVVVTLRFQVARAVAARWRPFGAAERSACWTHVFSIAFQGGCCCGVLRALSGRRMSTLQVLRLATRRLADDAVRDDTNPAPLLTAHP